MIDASPTSRVAVLVSVGLLQLVAASCSAPATTSLIEEVYVLDAEATTCLSCADGVVPGEVREAAVALDAAEYGQWLQQRFFTVYEDFNHNFKHCKPEEVGFFFDMGDSHGVRYEGDGFQVFYESIPCWYWDCYKPRMWRVDGSGTRLWRAKVPFAHAPVYPFVVGDYVLYVGSTTGVDELIIVDLATGRVVERFAPEGEKYGFSQSALLLDPPWYADGYIRLKGTEISRLDIPAKRTIVEEPAKTYVLKVRF